MDFETPLRIAKQLKPCFPAGGVAFMFANGVIICSDFGEHEPSSYNIPRVIPKLMFEEHKALVFTRDDARALTIECKGMLLTDNEKYDRVFFTFAPN